jgi:hypothetical protein
MCGISAYLIATNVGRCVPSGKGAAPKVELQPLGTPAKMQRVAGARNIAVGLWRSRPAIVCDIIYIAAPWMQHAYL